MRNILIILLLLLIIIFVFLDNYREQQLEQIPSIRALQRMLIAEGYDCGDNAPDGVIGPNTLTAYKHYDKYNCGGE